MIHTLLLLSLILLTSALLSNGLITPPLSTTTHTAAFGSSSTSRFSTPIVIPTTTSSSLPITQKLVMSCATPSRRNDSSSYKSRLVTSMTLNRGKSNRGNRSSLLPSFKRQSTGSSPSNASYRNKFVALFSSSWSGSGDQVPLNDDNNNNDSSSYSSSKETTVGWKDRLAKISNIASVLCVIDCTVLPIVTFVMPLLGFVASPAQTEWLHALGHALAIYFVLPVGGLVATLNFISLKRPVLTAPAMLGLVMIYVANAHGGPILSRLPHTLVHSLHGEGALHRVINVAGCAFLLGSNYYSHKMGCTHDHGKGGSCSHDHHHH